MKYSNLYSKAFIVTFLTLYCSACTKLDTPVYNQIENENYWKTPAQVAAGVAPAYTALQGLGSWGFAEIGSAAADEMVVPIRGRDWTDGGKHQRIFLHTWTADDGDINGIWSGLFTGIGRCNFILDIVNNLPEKPSNIDNINAELRVLRAYYYLHALDLFGNVPIVNSFNTDPSTIKNNTRQEVFDFVEMELKTNIPLVSSDVDATTYGRATKWMGFAALAKLYLNAQVYTGTARWSDCAAVCDSILLSGKYNLEAGYFDNFNPTNNFDNSKENIFVIPYDHQYITGNSRVNQTLHYNLNGTFGLTPGNMYNGWCVDGDFYYGNYDTNSVYTTNAGKTFRTFKDQRTGQFLVGQQFTARYPYPPDRDVLVASAAASDLLYDADELLILQPNFSVFEGNESILAKLVGARSIKYYPEAGTNSDQSNDVVMFRYADFILMRAECIMRGAPAGSTGSAADLVNQVRTRAYKGDVAHNWTGADITPVNMLAERARELAWEGWRRQDVIRFDVADGANYYGRARGGIRSPARPADIGGAYLRILPIPQAQYIANNNLTQNPGYPPF